MSSANYAPALRWKRAERTALRELDVRDAEGLLPIIELAPKDFGVSKPLPPEKCDARVLRFREEVMKCWGSRLLVVDASLIFSGCKLQDGRNVLEVFLDDQDGLPLRLIPVLAQGVGGVQRQWVSRAAGEGVALRLPAATLLGANGQQLVDALVSSLGQDRGQVFLIAETGYVQSTDPVYGRIGALSWLADFAGVIVLGGAFPVDLTGLQVGRCVLPRHEWASWSSTSQPKWLTYGDWTIQHPIYRELPTDHPHFSASIRYATSDSWVVMRGEDVFKAGGPGFAQWPANAQMLTMQPEWFGQAFSSGDQYIATMAAQQEKTGSAETWLAAGINHHLTLVSRQTAATIGS